MSRATRTRCSASRRTRPTTTSRRRTASSRASTTPTATPATTRPRSASRRCRPPTTCSPTPRSARRTTRSARPARAASRGGADMGGMRFEEFDLVEPRRSARRDVRRRRPARGEPAADPRQRPRDARADLVRGLAQGRAGARSRRGRDRVLGLSRDRRRAGHGAGHLPAVRRPRRRLRLAGPLRLLAAVPALPRERHDRREAVQALPRQPDASERRSATR